MSAVSASHWRILSSVFLLLATVGARAQWSNDPATNLIVSDLYGGTTQPKIAPTGDGGFYISWLSSPFEGYDVWLQRVDAAGNPLWPHNGVLIADRAYPLVVDYGLCTDADDNAYLAFACCTYGAPSERVNVSKISPDGTLAWGPSGLPASIANRGPLNAACAATDDGNVVAAWTQNDGVHAQKLDPNGALMWVVGGVAVSPSSGLNLLASVAASPQGEAIVSWNGISGATAALFAQKLDATQGTRLWNNGAPNPIFGAGNLQTSFYRFDVDGSGGAVFWDYDMSGMHDVPRVQHLDADGNALLGAAGVVATTDTSMDHTDTSASFDAGTGDVYVVWRDARVDASRTFEGVSAQRIDSTGALQWGDTGRVLVPLGNGDVSETISQLTALPAPDGFVASWVLGAAPTADQPLQATYLDATGNATWTTSPVDAKTQRYTAHAVAAVSTGGFFAYAWTDGDETAGTSTIRAQNIQLDGTLGNPPPPDSIFRDGFDGP